MLKMYIPKVYLPLNIQTYRVRFVATELSKEKRVEICEYGYNPNSNSRMRYNQPGELVLYTSTNPRTSYDETISPNDSDSHFYLSVWRKKDTQQQCSCFISAFNSICDDICSNAHNLKREYSAQLSPTDLSIIESIGCNLEREYSHKNENKYIKSAEIASHIFKYVDCIISPSAKNRCEVNITFNKDFADNSLVLDRVYYCGPFNSPTSSLVFRVKKIGIVSDNKVVWYNWSIKDCNNKIEQSSETFLFPNVNKSIYELHDGYLNNTKVEFKIELEAE